VVSGSFSLWEALRMRAEVKRIDLFQLFESGYNSEELSVGINEEVFVTINAPEITPKDVYVFRSMWSSGKNIHRSDAVVSTINAGILVSILGNIEEMQVEEILRKWSRLSIKVSYKKNDILHICRYNIVDLMFSTNVDNKLVSITMQISHLDVLSWLFTHEFISLISSNCA